MYGTWQFPLARIFATGRAGVWWPERQLVTHRASAAETELAVVNQVSDKVSQAALHALSLLLVSSPQAAMALCVRVVTGSLSQPSAINA